MMRFKSPEAAVHLLRYGSVITLRPATSSTDSLIQVFLGGVRRSGRRDYLDSVVLTLNGLDDATRNQLAEWLPESGFPTVTEWVHEAWRLSGRRRFNAFRVLLFE